MADNVQGTRDRIVNQTDQVPDLRELKFGGRGTRKLPIMLHATKMDGVIKRNRGTYLDCSRPSEVTSEFIPAHPLGDVWRVTFNL